MSIHSQFGTDAKLEKEGKVFTFTPNDNGSVPTVRLSYLTNTSDTYIMASARAYTFVRERDAVPAGTELSTDQNKEANLRAFADAIVVGWDNISDEIGLVVDDGLESKVAFLTEYPHFKNHLILLARDIEFFRTERKKAKTKN